jgi:hypothetical protein
MKSFHRLIPLCHYSAAANSEDSTQFNSSAPKLISRQDSVPKPDSSLYNNWLYAAEHFFITTLHGPHRKHSLYC